jgi:preprotein translocase subunit SecA
MRFLQPDEREGKIRARIESIVRSELLQFERTVVLKTADEAWRNHLYAMDQLRDSISYRAFSQNDPRIEFKREGSRMFTGMLEDVRGQVTEYVFKARLSPTPPPMPRPPMSQRPPGAGPMITGGITGPGMGGGQMM